MHQHNYDPDIGLKKFTREMQNFEQIVQQCGLRCSQIDSSIAYTRRFGLCLNMELLISANRTKATGHRLEGRNRPKAQEDKNPSVNLYCYRLDYPQPISRLG